MGNVATEAPIVCRVNDFLVQLFGAYVINVYSDTIDMADDFIIRLDLEKDQDKAVAIIKQTLISLYNVDELICNPSTDVYLAIRHALEDADCCGEYFARKL